MSPREALRVEALKAASHSHQGHHTDRIVAVAESYYEWLAQDLPENTETGHY